MPKKIKYDTKVMEYSTGKQDYLGYYSNGNGNWLFQYLFDKCRNTEHFINDEVEIIEEDKKIEKYDTGLDNGRWTKSSIEDGLSKDMTLEEIVIEIGKEQSLIKEKLFELIDKVNSLGGEQ